MFRRCRASSRTNRWKAHRPPRRPTCGYCSMTNTSTSALAAGRRTQSSSWSPTTCVATAPACTRLSTWTSSSTRSTTVAIRSTSPSTRLGVVRMGRSPTSVTTSVTGTLSGTLGLDASMAGGLSRRRSRSSRCDTDRAGRRSGASTSGGLSRTWRRTSARFLTLYQQGWALRRPHSLPPWSGSRSPKLDGSSTSSRMRSLTWPLIGARPRRCPTSSAGTSEST